MERSLAASIWLIHEITFSKSHFCELRKKHDLIFFHHLFLPGVTKHTIVVVVDGGPSQNVLPQNLIHKSCGGGPRGTAGHRRPGYPRASTEAAERSQQYIQPTKKQK